MLEAEDIVFSYTKGQKPVLDHISLSVGPEEHRPAAGNRTGHRTGLENKISAGTVRRGTAAVLHRESAGAENQISDCG